METRLRAASGSLVGALLALGVGGCAGPETTVVPAEAEGFAASASSAAGMVVTGSPYATEAGVRMLEAGGNAVDAAVAAAFALGVAEPTQSGLGGRTQMLVRMADGTVHGIDGTTQVPAVYDPTTAPEGEHGHAAVGIPGTVAALARALEAHGTVPLADALAPALEFAREGIALPAGEARRLGEVAGELDPASEIARVFYGPDVTPLEAGAALVQEDLAAVLQTLADEGPDAFYRGDIGRRIAEDMAAHGGFVTAADLADYRAEDSQVGLGYFGGYRVRGTYLPASGVTVIEILQILDRLALDANDSGRWSATLVEALLAGFEDRELAEERLTPPEAVAWLTSDSLADRRAAEIADKLRTIALARAVPGAAVSALAFDEGSEPAFTTHVSVADTFGNVVSLSQSLGPTLGARVVTPGLGFVYASTLGGYLTGGGPGYRPWSSQAPLVVVREDRSPARLGGGGEGLRPVMVLGGAGSRRILSALVSVLTRVVHDGQTLEAALAGPRLHPTGDRVDVQEGWPAGEAMEALGYSVSLREPSYFARLNGVEIAGPRAFVGVGEPRWPESAAGGPRR
ncbi:MAG: gamma-glutamyltransferase [Gemmatimonadota bacterium]